MWTLKKSPPSGLLTMQTLKLCVSRECRSDCVLNGNDRDVNEVQDVSGGLAACNCGCRGETSRPVAIQSIPSLQCPEAGSILARGVFIAAEDEQQCDASPPDDGALD